MKNLKYLFFSILLICSIAPTFGQLAIRYPTDVRYIGGGYIDKRPQFSTLEAALNDVKDYATINRPYVFWVSSDTINIADWDSVFTESGLTMKDSIDLYYVAEGKIKWGGFGFGGSGSSESTIIPTQTETTTHYSYPNWDQNNGVLSLWIRDLAQATDSIDQHIWDLIVYTDSAYLYIENDTLKLRTNTVTALVNSVAGRPDTTIIAYNAQNEIITGDWEFDGDITIDAGSLRLPTANNRTSTSRILWSASNNLYWSHSGAAGDSGQVAMLNASGTYVGQLRNSNTVGWANLTDGVKDSFAVAGTDTFTTTATADTITITGMSTTSYVVVTPQGSTYNVNDILFAKPETNKLIVKRNAGGTSGLKYTWIWNRKKTY